MLSTKIQPQNFLESKEEDFYVFYHICAWRPSYSRISHAYSSLFIIVINLIFMFSLCIKKTKLVATLKKFCRRHHDLVNPYNVAVSRIVSDVSASDAP